MRGAPGRLAVFGVAAFICIGLLALSLAGLLRPIESVAALPLGIFQNVVGGLSSRLSELFSTFGDLQNLRQRNADLERALINFQAELVELREIRADYERLSALLRYLDNNVIEAGIAARVVGRDTSGLQRTIIIDRGSRDGLRAGMPVVTELGLVGRITRVGATNAQVELITDPNSYVNARLQLTRAEGSVKGTVSGGLQMIFIPLNADVQTGDSVITSGLGGNFPRGILIGQVTGSQLDASSLFKQANVRSLIDFNRLEVVLVVTNFERVDLSTFATPTPGP